MRSLYLLVVTGLKQGGIRLTFPRLKTEGTDYDVSIDAHPYFCCSVSLINRLPPVSSCFVMP